MKRLRWRDLTIAARLSAVATLILVPTGLLLFAISVVQFRTMTERELALRLDERVTLLGHLVQDPAIVGDYAGIESAVEAQAKLDDAGFAAFADADGHRIAVEARTKAVVAPDWFVGLLGIPPMAVTRTLQVGGRRYGSVEVGLAPNRSINAAWQNLLTISAVGGFVLVALVAAILFFARRSLRPLEELAAGARSLAAGHLDSRVTVEGARDLRELTGAFNQMAEALGKAIGDLRRHGRELELAQAQVMREVGERRLVEDELKQRMIELDAILDNSSVGIVLVRNRAVQWANRRMAEIFGFGDEPMSGMPTRAFYETEADYEGFGARAYPVLGAGGRYVEERRMRRRDGAMAWMRMSGKAIDPERTGAGSIWVFEDIATQKETEQRLQTSEQLLRSSIDTIGEAFCVFDADDRLVLYNDKYCEVYRTTAPAIQKGRTFEEIVRYGLERGQYKAAIGREEAWLAERLAAHRRGDTDIVQPIDGGRWLKIRERRTATGHLVGFRVDVTDLVQAREEARAASVAKSRFLATMSHEIRTPMNSVLAIAQLLEREELEEEQAAMVRQIHAAGDALLHVINDILDFSKIEAGQLTLENRPFGPAASVERVADLLRGGAVGKGLEFSVDVADAARTHVNGDPMRLEQVLINLVGNAIKFTERGRIRIAVRVVEADEADERDALRLRFAVSDTGIGIAPGPLAVLFTPFTQADSGISRRYGGTGLGLAISKRLIEEMGGSIGAESAFGVGSTFWFELPFERAAAPPAEAGQPREAAIVPASRLPGLRVLVVDDNPMNQSVVERILKRAGAVTVQASDGREALEILLAQPNGFDAILMDVQMPVMDGLAATRAIRAEPLLATLPVIAVSAGVMADERAAAEAAGVDGFLPKPLDVRQLVAMLVPIAERCSEARPASS